MRFVGSLPVWLHAQQPKIWSACLGLSIALGEFRWEGGECQALQDGGVEFQAI